MNINEFCSVLFRMGAHCLFRHEAEVSSELICSRWIFNSLIYPYSNEFISHVASKHAVWHLYFCDITIHLNLDITRFVITRMRIGPQFLPNLPFSYLLNGSMLSKRDNTDIETVNYYTFTLTLPCLITQCFAIKTLIIHLLTLRYMYRTMTRVKYPRFGRPD